MKKSILLLLLTCSGYLAFTQPFDCNRFREGRFRTADPNAGGVIISERKGGFQTETNESLKAVVRFRISWVDNCNYTLRLDKVLRNEHRINFPSNLVIKVKILETARNSYTQESSSSITNGTYRSSVTKLD